MSIVVICAYGRTKLPECRKDYRLCVLALLVGVTVWNGGAEGSPMKNPEDAPATAYTDFLQVPRTEREIATKLRLPISRVEKTLASLRALKFVRQNESGEWVSV